jgi:hypothetical protein
LSLLKKIQGKEKDSTNLCSIKLPEYIKTQCWKVMERTGESQTSVVDTKDRTWHTHGAHNSFLFIFPFFTFPWSYGLNVHFKTLVDI